MNPVKSVFLPFVPFLFPVVALLFSFKMELHSFSLLILTMGLIYTGYCFEEGKRQTSAILANVSNVLVLGFILVIWIVVPLIS